MRSLTFIHRKSQEDVKLRLTWRRAIERAQILGAVVRLFGGVGSRRPLQRRHTGIIAELMVGRTPEYMGKKVEAYDVKMAMLNLLIFPLTILVFTAISSVSPGFGTSQLNNAGPHGLSEMLYAFTSGTGNNGSAFGGIWD